MRFHCLTALLCTATVSSTTLAGCFEPVCCLGCCCRAVCCVQSWCLRRSVPKLVRLTRTLQHATSSIWATHSTHAQSNQPVHARTFPSHCHTSHYGNTLLLSLSLANIQKPLHPLHRSLLYTGILLLPSQTRDISTENHELAHCQPPSAVALLIWELHRPLSLNCVSDRCDSAV